MPNEQLRNIFLICYLLNYFKRKIFFSEKTKERYSETALNEVALNEVCL